MRGEKISELDEPDSPPPDIKPHYLPHISLRAALQGRATGIYPRNIDEIVDVDESLQADIAMWNNLIDYIARGDSMMKPPK